MSKLRLLLTVVVTIPMRAVKAKAYFIFVPTIAVTAILRWVFNIVSLAHDAKMWTFIDTKFWSFSNYDSLDMTIEGP
jgi:hypothetical protein